MSNEQPSFAEEIQRRMTLMQAYLDGAQIEIKGLMRSAYGGFRFVCECSHTPISH